MNYRRRVGQERTGKGADDEGNNPSWNVRGNRRAAMGSTSKPRKRSEKVLPEYRCLAGHRTDIVPPTFAVSLIPQQF